MLSLFLLLLIARYCTAVNMAKYEEALKSYDKLQSLYIEKFGAGEMTAESFDSFEEALKFVVEQNKNPDIAWESDINFFAPMTKEERKDILLVPDYSSSSDYSGYKFDIGSNENESVDWVSDGFVREVQDQTTDCRSCWAFAAAVAIEGRYQLKTGDAVDFSEQEMVNCVYWAKARKEDGCYGGHYADVFDFVGKFGHLADESSAPYEGKVGACDYDDVPNKLQKAYIDKSDTWTGVSWEDQAIIDTLLEGPIATGVKTTQSFLFYSSGVFQDDTCKTLIPNHAVALVGYDRVSYRVKNSWGKVWGDRGYMSVARGHHACGMVFYGVVPNILTGTPDTSLITQPPACYDKWGEVFCSKYLAYCTYYKDWCAKSCDNC